MRKIIALHLRTVPRDISLPNIAYEISGISEIPIYFYQDFRIYRYLCQGLPDFQGFQRRLKNIKSPHIFVTLQGPHEMHYFTKKYESAKGYCNPSDKKNSVFIFRQNLIRVNSIVSVDYRLNQFTYTNSRNYFKIWAF